MENLYVHIGVIVAILIWKIVTKIWKFICTRQKLSDQIKKDSTAIKSKQIEHNKIEEGKSLLKGDEPIKLKIL